MLKVFLVEDESLIREGLRNNIPWEQYGYRLVGDAADGEMALPLIRKTRPDVIITDIKMPFMDGLSLSKVVSAEFPKVKIIIISGHDDFEYARQAIEVGVEQYLLKPITKMTLKKVLLELREKIEQDMEQEDYQAKFQAEMHAYEQFARRRFFEKVLEGELSVQEIYEEAAKLSLELTASCYNLMFFSVQEKNQGYQTEKTEKYSRQQDEILHYFLRHPQYILFSWNVGCYGVLIKSETDMMQVLTENCINQIQEVCEDEESEVNWYVAVGKPVERLSLLHECYESVNRLFAHRFVMPDAHILTENRLADYLTGQEDGRLEHVSPANMDPEVIRDFLAKGSMGEIDNFVESYLRSVGEALESRVFRDYVVLNIRFATIAYIESIGSGKEEHSEKLSNQYPDMNRGKDEVNDYFADMLRAAMTIRDEKSDFQSRKMMRKALEYIDENYAKENLSLNEVADEVKVSANYFSAVFSQNMQKTFVEYVTAKRMEKAKKLLRNTEKSFGEIAMEVGYKDAHYFSFVFKKTQKCSPREYRAGKKQT